MFTLDKCAETGRLWIPGDRGPEAVENEGSSVQGDKKCFEIQW